MKVPDLGHTRASAHPYIHTFKNKHIPNQFELSFNYYKKMYHSV